MKSLFKGQHGVCPELRFEAYTAKGPCCWEWQGDQDKDGYGIFWDGEKSVRAHRRSFEKHHKIALTAEIWICHRCDNPRCVRPDHLFQGDNDSNSADRAQKSRTRGFAARKGPDHTQSKLTIDDYLEIRRMYSSGMLQREIAAVFNMTQGSISRVLKRKLK